MTQRWNDLLFLHYALAPEVLRPLVPEVLDPRHLPAARVGIGHAILDQSSAPAGCSIPSVAIAFCRSQRAHLRYPRRQTRRVFFQPRRQQFVGGMGRARVLSPALLASVHEAEGPRRPEDRIRLEAAARAQTSRTPLLLWSNARRHSRRIRAHSSTSSPSDIACTPATANASTVVKSTIFRGSYRRRRLSCRKILWRNPPGSRCSRSRNSCFCP